MPFRVWCYDEFKEMNADEREDRAWPVPDLRGVLNPESRVPVHDHRQSAKLFAEYCHSRDGWEWGWPIDVVVHDGTKYWRIEVERETVPEFIAGRPQELACPDGCRRGCLFGPCRKVYAP